MQHGLGGLGNNQMAGMSEQEQAMVKMVCSSIPIYSSSDSSTNNHSSLDASRYGVMPRQDRHLRYNGFRTWWCLRSLHGQCKSNAFPIIPFQNTI